MAGVASVAGHMVGSAVPVEASRGREAWSEGAGVDGEDVRPGPVLLVYLAAHVWRRVSWRLASAPMGVLVLLVVLLGARALD